MVLNDLHHLATVSMLVWLIGSLQMQFLLLDLTEVASLLGDVSVGYI